MQNLLNRRLQPDSNDFKPQTSNVKPHNPDPSHAHYLTIIIIIPSNFGHLCIIKKNDFMIQYITAEEAVKVVKTGNRVFIHGSAATPVHLIHALQERYRELQDVELVSITSLGDVDFNNPVYRESFFMNSLFVSANTRSVINSEYGDYTPIFLSQIPQLFRENILPLDVALIQVSAPDLHGYCSLGTSVDIAKSAVEMAKHVIALVNPNMPRTHGDGFVHVSRFNTMVWHESELPEVDYSQKLSATVSKIGENVASLIEDGATLQLGIGNIPDQVLKNLTGHKNLGLHTEMLSDGVIPLIESGVINNSLKKLNRGRSVTGFMAGTSKLYRYVHDNPTMRVMDIAYVNDTSVIRQNPKATAINSAIEIDLTGQVCADSIGTYQYSGIGGQMDFMRGASLSERGKPIIALPSVTSKGESRIVPFLKEGAGVVTTRGHVHWVVTEYGIVNLFGQSMKNRAKALISIAHPDHREALEKACFHRFTSRQEKNAKVKA
jgi:acyl-CoA hydrolase